MCLTNGKNELCLVDTPGLNEEKLLSELTQTFASDCFAVICVLNSQHGLTESVSSANNKSLNFIG
jgi:hypothetical protein